MNPYQAPSRTSPNTHQRNADKLARIPIKVEARAEPLRKPAWIRTRVGSNEKVTQIKKLLRKHQLHSVCEEAACPNLGECFSGGTATFMIMGDICTRRCPFCDVAHGRPQPLDPHEPEHIATAIAALDLNYVVITSVDRDDLRDGGGAHFAECIKQIRLHNRNIIIEILTPDFRARMDVALEMLAKQLPDVFNHNLETVPRLYKKARPGANYEHSLKLIEGFKSAHPSIPGKSGLMLGLGETIEETQEVMRDLRDHQCDMLTLGQYLQPSREHLAVAEYIHPDQFEKLAEYGYQLGFTHIASGPMVRSSYHADQQAHKLIESLQKQ